MMWSHVNLKWIVGMSNNMNMHNKMLVTFMSHEFIIELDSRLKAMLLPGSIFLQCNDF